MSGSSTLSSSWHIFFQPILSFDELRSKERGNRPPEDYLRSMSEPGAVMPFRLSLAFCYINDTNATGYIVKGKITTLRRAVG